VGLPKFGDGPLQLAAPVAVEPIPLTPAVNKNIASKLQNLDDLDFTGNASDMQSSIFQPPVPPQA
jgi:hypothetical protein